MSCRWVGCPKLLGNDSCDVFQGRMRKTSQFQIGIPLWLNPFLSLWMVDFFSCLSNVVRRLGTVMPAMMSAIGIRENRRTRNGVNSSASFLNCSFLSVNKTLTTERRTVLWLYAYAILALSTQTAPQNRVANLICTQPTFLNKQGGKPYLHSLWQFPQVVDYNLVVQNKKFLHSR